MRICPLLSMILIFSGYFLQLQSQNEAQKWIFGGTAGLDFSTNPPTVFGTGTMYTEEGCTSISDASGNLLFYSDGMVVYNKAFQPMANGTGLKGFYSTTQSSLIVKKPGANSIYYLFTLHDGSLGEQRLLAYSTVDMNLAAGMGSVTTKNVILSDSCTEKMAAVRHCNGTDTWVAVHVAELNQFRAFNVGPTGVNAVPVKSSTGSTLLQKSQGYMKFSPNGKKLGSASFSPANIGLAVGLFDFNAALGIFSNPLSLGTNFDSPYGCEFSPDGTKFYSSSGTSLLQWNLCAGAGSAVSASQLTVGTTTTNIANFRFAAMQLAPDGKIYLVESRYSNQFLSVINNPNAIGTACNFSSNAQALSPRYCVWGLPNFISSYFKQLSLTVGFSPSGTDCKTVSFTAPPNTTAAGACTVMSYSYSHLTWDFGDPASGASNTSAVTNPTHVFSSTGQHTIKTILHGTCGNDTIIKKINVDCVGLKNNSAEIPFRVFPNPVVDILTVENSISQEFELTNAVGQPVLKFKLEKGTHKVDLGRLAEGVYFLRTAGNGASVKFVKIP